MIIRRLQLATLKVKFMNATACGDIYENPCASFTLEKEAVLNELIGRVIFTVSFSASLLQLTYIFCHNYLHVSAIKKSSEENLSVYLPTEILTIFWRLILSPITTLKINEFLFVEYLFVSTCIRWLLHIYQLKIKWQCIT